MTNFYVQFTGRQVGAIGITYPDNVIVEADDLSGALLKVYDTHDHLSDLRITNQATGHSYEGFDFKPITVDD